MVGKDYLQNKENPPQPYSPKGRRDCYDCDGGCVKRAKRLLLLLTKQLRRIYIKLESPFPCTIQV